VVEVVVLPQWVEQVRVWVEMEQQPQVEQVAVGFSGSTATETPSSVVVVLVVRFPVLQLSQ
jgi:hypothetical protein